MSRTFCKRLGVTLALCFLLGEIPQLSQLLASTCTPVFGTTAPRGGNTPAIVRTLYDYQPSVLKDGSLYRMWWCGGVAGDHIVYAQATTLGGPWSTPSSVFQPTYTPGTFDEQHVCDPTVIKVGATYYMFYGAAEADGHPGVIPITRIGVASSPNGITWTRLNNGQPIVSPARGPGHPDFPALQGANRAYGAGQPTVAYVNNRFYLMFTDSTGYGSATIGGAGQFVLRSGDPTFKINVEELTGPGVFSPYTPAAHTSWAFMWAFGLDWQYVTETDSFAIAEVGGPSQNQIRVSLYDSSLSRKEGEVWMDGSWNEGPGLVSSADRRSLPGATCGNVKFDIMRAVGSPSSVNTWDLAHVGIDWATGLPCDCVSSPTLNQPGMNTAGDFTGDNRDDLGNHHRSSGSFWVRRNLGNGTFAPEFDRWPTGASAPSTAGWQTIIGDFDGDNWTDYADRHPDSGHIWVHRNLQNGSFDSGNWASGYTTVGADIEILAGDFDGDGRADLLEHNRKTGRLSIRRNMGPGDNKFIPVEQVTAYRTVNGSAGSDWRLVVADFNGDGWADVADLTLTSKDVYVHPNVGGYQFGAVSWPPFASHWAFNAIFGDFDGDGWADFADLNVGNGELWVHRNLHNFTFDPTDYAHGYYSTAGGGMWILGLPFAF